MAMLPHGGEASESDTAFGLGAGAARALGGWRFVQLSSSRQAPVVHCGGRCLGQGHTCRAVHGPGHQPDPATGDGLGRSGRRHGHPQHGAGRRQRQLHVRHPVPGHSRSGASRAAFCSAGHTAPAWFGTARRLIVATAGPALGLAPELDFPLNRLQLAPGDRLAVFTDGIDEAFNERDEMFGIDRFNTELLAGRDLPAAAAGPTCSRRSPLSPAPRPNPTTSDCCCWISAPPNRPTTPLPPNSTVGRALPAGWRPGCGRHWRGGTSGQNPGELLLVAEEIVSNIDKYAGWLPMQPLPSRLRPHPARSLSKCAMPGSPLTHWHRRGDRNSAPPPTRRRWVAWGSPDLCTHRPAKLCPGRAAIYCG